MFVFFFVLFFFSFFLPEKTETYILIARWPSHKDQKSQATLPGLWVPSHRWAPHAYIWLIQHSVSLFPYHRSSRWLKAWTEVSLLIRRRCFKREGPIKKSCKMCSFPFSLITHPGRRRKWSPSKRGERRRRGQSGEERERKKRGEGVGTGVVPYVFLIQILWRLHFLF